MKKKKVYLNDIKDLAKDPFWAAGAIKHMPKPIQSALVSPRIREQILHEAKVKLESVFKPSFGLQILSHNKMPDDEILTFKSNETARLFISALDFMPYEDAKEFFKIKGEPNDDQ